VDVPGKARAPQRQARIHPDRCIVARARKAQSTERIVAQRQATDKLDDDILWWRHLGISIISEADRVLCPSIDAAKRIRKYVPDSRIIVAPHEEELYRPQRTVRLSPLRPSEPLRVAVLGTLSEHKGGNFFLDCVEIANEVGAPITWDVIGHFLSPSLNARAKQLAKFLNVTGGYGAGDVQRLIDDARPHVLFFPQRWPETYSFTLSEALQTGYPILAPDSKRPPLGDCRQQISMLAAVNEVPSSATSARLIVFTPTADSWARSAALRELPVPSHFRDFSFNRLRRRTPGPSPFSSMNTTPVPAGGCPRAQSYRHRFRFFFAIRRPKPPISSSSMNWIPACSNAAWIRTIVDT
jgi:hypothetical protein